MTRPLPGILVLVLTYFPMVVSGSLFKDVHNLLTGDEWERTFGEPFTGYVPEYDVTHPTQVDVSGNFLSHDFTNGNTRRRRELNQPIREPLFLKLSAFGQEFFLNVTLNGGLFSPNFAIEIRSNGSSTMTFDEVKHCHYAGQLMSAKAEMTSVALSNCDGLRGLIHSPEDSLMVSPLPGRLGLHKNNSQAHVIYRRSAALPHVSLLREKRSENWCGMEDEHSSRSKRSTSHGQRSARSMNVRQTYTVETLVVADKKMVEFHGVEQLKTYVPSQMNMVQQLIGDSSIGARINFVIHKLLILEHDQEGLVISSHAANTLDSFCSWVKGQNIEDDTNPEHFDHAVLISRFDFCRNANNIKGQNCEKVLGLARVEGMCSVGDSCTLNKDTGLGTAFTVAHETGHSLGANHDGAGNACQNAANVMGTSASGQRTAFEWSACSRQAIREYLSGDQSDCLADEAVRAVKLPKSLPGQLYDADDQCRRHVGDGTRVCPAPQLMEKICYQLWCLKSDHSCVTNFEPAAEGTKCDEGKWCRRGVCVPLGSEGPEAVDGQYSPWGPWSSCSQTCGGGVRKRERACDNPAPAFGGLLCEGESEEFQTCSSPECPANAVSSRQRQCTSKNGMEFLDGMTYAWEHKPAVPVPDSTKCQLQCFADVGPRQFVKFNFGNVEDGTVCDEFDENTGVCLAGKCTRLGCDNVIGSEAAFDRCGVCNGDGTSCVAKRFTYKGTPVPFKGHYQKIGIIPRGVRNLQIKELRGVKNFLALMTLGGEDLLNMDFKIRPRRYVFVGAGTKFTYTRETDLSEKITAAGPLKEAIQILFLVQSWREEYMVRYRYLVARPPEKESAFALREPEETRFVWQARSLGCSVTCGTGVETTQFICALEQDGTRVSDHFCAGVRREDEITPCNLQQCPASWKVGQWTDCSKTCNAGRPGTRSREVVCSVTSAGIETEVGDGACAELKPNTREECALEACPANWVTVGLGRCSTTCGKGTRHVQLACRRAKRDGTAEDINDEHCQGVKPPDRVACNVDKPCGP